MLIHVQHRLESSLPSILHSGSPLFRGVCLRSFAALRMTACRGFVTLSAAKGLARRTERSFPFAAAQDDRQGNTQVGSREVFSPNVWAVCYLLVNLDAACYNKG